MKRSVKTVAVFITLLILIQAFSVTFFAYGFDNSTEGLEFHALDETDPDAVALAENLEMRYLNILFNTPSDNDSKEQEGKTEFSGEEWPVNGYYDPGRDYSDTDNVSIGKDISWTVDFTLRSKTNASIMINRAGIYSSESGYKSSATGEIRYINDSDDPHDITDNGKGETINTVNLTSRGVAKQKMSGSVRMMLPVYLVSPLDTPVWKTKLVPDMGILLEIDGHIIVADIPEERTQVYFAGSRMNHTFKYETQDPKGELYKRDVDAWQTTFTFVSENESKSDIDTVLESRYDPTKNPPVKYKVYKLKIWHVDKMCYPDHYNDEDYYDEFSVYIDTGDVDGTTTHIYYFYTPAEKYPYYLEDGTEDPEHMMTIDWDDVKIVSGGEKTDVEYEILVDTTEDLVIQINPDKYRDFVNNFKDSKRYVNKDGDILLGATWLEIDINPVSDISELFNEENCSFVNEDEKKLYTHDPVLPSIEYSNFSLLGVPTLQKRDRQSFLNSRRNHTILFSSLPTAGKNIKSTTVSYTSDKEVYQSIEYNNDTRFRAVTRTTKVYNVTGDNTFELVSEKEENGYVLGLNIDYLEDYYQKTNLYAYHLNSNYDYYEESDTWSGESWYFYDREGKQVTGIGILGNSPITPENAYSYGIRKVEIVTEKAEKVQWASDADPHYIGGYDGTELYNMIDSSILAYNKNTQLILNDVTVPEDCYDVYYAYVKNPYGDDTNQIFKELIPGENTENAYWLSESEERAPGYENSEKVTDGYPNLRVVVFKESPLWDKINADHSSKNIKITDGIESKVEGQLSGDEVLEYYKKSYYNNGDDSGEAHIFYGYVNASTGYKTIDEPDDSWYNSYEEKNGKVWRIYNNGGTPSIGGGWFTSNISTKDNACAYRPYIVDSNYVLYTASIYEVSSYDEYYNYGGKLFNFSRNSYVEDKIVPKFSSAVLKANSKIKITIPVQWLPYIADFGEPVIGEPYRDEYYNLKYTEIPVEKSNYTTYYDAQGNKVYEIIINEDMDLIKKGTITSFDGYVYDYEESYTAFVPIKYDGALNNRTLPNIYASRSSYSDVPFDSLLDTFALVNDDDIYCRVDSELTPKNVEVPLSYFKSYSSVTIQGVNLLALSAVQTLDYTVDESYIAKDGADVMYKANLYNEYSDDIFYAAFAVPTDKYNRAQGSTDVPAYITSITAEDSEVYYITEDKATDADIEIVKNGESSGVNKTLPEYTENVIMSEGSGWTRYDGNLPDNVVMFVVKTRTIAQKTSKMITYYVDIQSEVNGEAPEGEPIAENKAVYVYTDSKGVFMDSGEIATCGYLSNPNIIIEAPKITLSADIESLSEMCRELTYTATVTTPENTVGYTNLVIEDVIPEGLNLLPDEVKLMIKDDNGELVEFSGSKYHCNTGITVTGNKISCKITPEYINLSALAGKELALEIPVYMEEMYLSRLIAMYGEFTGEQVVATLTDNAQLIYNNNTVNSNDVNTDVIATNIITVVDPVFYVTYDANGGTGDVPVDENEYKEGASVTVADKGNLKNGELIFTGWNTMADGSGDNYSANDIMIMPKRDVTLYASWKPYEPTTEPTAPTTDPTAEPTTEPTALPTDPTAEPITEPTAPTTDPTTGPTTEPTAPPTDPTAEPTTEPTAPTTDPTAEPTTEPTAPPTDPTAEPTTEPTAPPTDPTAEPTTEPTVPPTDPTAEPTTEPTVPTTDPTTEPTTEPTAPPTAPTTDPTAPPTDPPTEPPIDPPTDPPVDPTNPSAPAEKYKVTYDGNGNTGGEAPIDNNSYLKGNNATVLNNGTLVKAGFKFICWNTKSDGTGSNYNPDELILVNDNITLYAIWGLDDTPDPAKPETPTDNQENDPTDPSSNSGSNNSPTSPSSANLPGSNNNSSIGTNGNGGSSVKTGEQNNIIPLFAVCLTAVFVAVVLFRRKIENDS